MPNHPKDRYVLALAVTAPASLLVTRNLRHFSGAEEHGVTVVHPDRFLCDLFDSAPEEVRAALDRQTAKLRRPASTRTQVLERLAGNSAPEFARRLAE